MIGFLAHPFKDFKENVLYFIPVAIGMLLGIGLFSYPIEYLLENYQVFVLWSFAGAIIGTVPSLLKESTRESDRDKIDLAWFWTTFIISGLGLYALNFVVGTLSGSFLNFVLAGALLALGVLVPGLSPSNLLLILGLYAPMLTRFKPLTSWEPSSRLESGQVQLSSFFKIDGLCLKQLSLTRLSFHHRYRPIKYPFDFDPNAGNAEMYPIPPVFHLSVMSSSLLLCTRNLAWYLDESIGG